MTHGEKRRVFTSCLADLIMEMNRRGYGVMIKGAGEVDLNPTIELLKKCGTQEAREEINRLLNSSHKHKKGSLHYQDLAVDLDLTYNGDYLPSGEEHRQFGEYWKSLNPLCTWGGVFKNKDGNHYSFGEGL